MSILLGLLGARKFRIYYPSINHVEFGLFRLQGLTFVGKTSNPNGLLKETSPIAWSSGIRIDVRIDPILGWFHSGYFPGQSQAVAHRAS